MKITLSVDAVANLVKGTLIGSNTELFANICTDTRKIEVGDLFIALVGEKFDGHDFVGSACHKGAAIAIVDREISALTIPQIVVHSTLNAYGILAAYCRDKFVGPVFGITGSCGKTSSKGMLASILAEVGNVHATAGNFNNEVGVPLTLSEINLEQTEYVVVEMGAGKPHDIAYLANIVRPNFAMVTIVAPAHLEGFGSLKLVQDTKFEIFSNEENLQGCAINGDDAYAAQWKAKLESRDLRVLTFGQSIANDIHVTHVKTNINGSQFSVASPQGRFDVVLNVPGMHMVMNALGVITLALMAGIELESIITGLGKYQSGAGRIAMRNLDGINIIDDTYNANPASVKAAIDTLEMANPRRVAVLGDMAELGPESECLHADIGRYAQGKVDAFFCWGMNMKFAAQQYGEQAIHSLDKKALAEDLSKYLLAGDTLLIKGSRSSAMEQIIEHLERLREVQ